MAAQAYPFLSKLAPKRFARLLAATEVGVGTALLLPMVPSAVAGAALTLFAGGLTGMYLRLPGTREPGSIWPTQRGIPLAKDSWLVGIGLSLLLDGLTPAGDISPECE